MQQRHVTLRGRTYFIEPPFFVMETQNPYEHEGVFPITESQLDRFLVKVELVHGDEDAELHTLDLPHRGVIPDMLATSRRSWASGRSSLRRRSSMRFT